MSADRLNSVVFVSKNIDLDATLADLLGSYYEHDLFRSVKDDFKARSDIDLAKDLIDNDNNVIDWDVVEEVINIEESNMVF